MASINRLLDDYYKYRLYGYKHHYWFTFTEDPQSLRLKVVAFFLFWNNDRNMADPGYTPKSNELEKFIFFFSVYANKRAHDIDKLHVLTVMELLGHLEEGLNLNFGCQFVLEDADRESLMGSLRCRVQQGDLLP